METQQWLVLSWLHLIMNMISLESLSLRFEKSYQWSAACFYLINDSLHQNPAFSCCYCALSFQVKCSALTSFKSLIRNSLQFLPSHVLFICNSLTSTPPSLLNQTKWRKLLLRLKLNKSQIKDALSVSVFLWRCSVCIFSSGNLGSQLVEYKEEMYITADCGKTWRQVRLNSKTTLMICKLVLQRLFAAWKMSCSVTCHHAWALLLFNTHLSLQTGLGLFFEFSLSHVLILPNFIWHPLICCRFRAQYVANSSVCLNVLSVISRIVAASHLLNCILLLMTLNLDYYSDDD